MHSCGPAGHFAQPFGSLCVSASCQLSYLCEVRSEDVVRRLYEILYEFIALRARTSEGLSRYSFFD
jgi:hypothetical protein